MSGREERDRKTPGDSLNARGGDGMHAFEGGGGGTDSRKHTWNLQS